MAQMRYDYVPDVPDSVIEQRLKSIEGDIPLKYNKEVKRQINYFTVQNREWTRRSIERSTRYFPIFEQYLTQYNMPEELKYLAVVESGLNPNAVSRASAVGLWQFMYMTGRSYNMESTWYIDDRMDPHKSTEAACRFLKYLHGYFGDWLLALAAYNSGAGRVNKATRRTEVGRDFYDIYPYLPAETRAYVPKFVAIMYAFEYAEEHNLLPQTPLHLPEHDTVRLSQYVHLETMADHLGVCLDDILALNPQIKRGAIPDGTKNYVLRLPSDVMPRFDENRVAILDSASKVGKAELEKMARDQAGSVYGRNKVVYTVRSGDVLGSIATRYKVRVADIQQWNQLRGTTIRIGQKLAIWVKTGESTSTSVSQRSTTVAPVIQGNHKVYQVQPGDTLWRISQINNVSIETLKALNNLSTDQIKAGQTLIIGSK